MQSRLETKSTLRAKRAIVVFTALVAVSVKASGQSPRSNAVPLTNSVSVIKITNLTLTPALPSPTNYSFVKVQPTNVTSNLPVRHSATPAITPALVARPQNVETNH